MFRLSDPEKNSGPGTSCWRPVVTRFRSSKSCDGHPKRVTMWHVVHVIAPFLHGTCGHQLGKRCTDSREHRQRSRCVICVITRSPPLRGRGCDLHRWYVARPPWIMTPVVSKFFQTYYLSTPFANGVLTSAKRKRNITIRLSRLAGDLCGVFLNVWTSAFSPIINTETNDAKYS